MNIDIQTLKDNKFVYDTITPVKGNVLSVNNNDIVGHNIYEYNISIDSINLNPGYGPTISLLNNNFDSPVNTVFVTLNLLYETDLLSFNDNYVDIQLCVNNEYKDNIRYNLNTQNINHITQFYRYEFNPTTNVKIELIVSSNVSGKILGEYNGHKIRQQIVFM